MWPHFFHIGANLKPDDTHRTLCAPTWLTGLSHFLFVPKSLLGTKQMESMNVTKMKKMDTESIIQWLKVNELEILTESFRN